MAVLAPPKPVKSAGGLPEVRRWTFEEFQDHTLDRGLGNRRWMLIDGMILEEGPMNNPHIQACDLTAGALRAAFGPGHFVREDKPLKLGQHTDPRPDAYVLPGTTRDYPNFATTAVLVVEVADSSIVDDLGVKRTLYAQAKIQDYWVLDIVNRRLHVFRQPKGDSFGVQDVLTEPETVSPLAKPDAVIRVADLLP